MKRGEERALLLEGVECAKGLWLEGGGSMELKASMVELQLMRSRIMQEEKLYFSVISCGHILL